MNHVLHEVQMPTWEGTILRENRQTIVKYRDTPRPVVICAKTAEPIEVPFGLWTRMGRKHRVTWEVQIPYGTGQFWRIGASIVKYRHFLP